MKVFFVLIFSLGLLSCVSTRESSEEYKKALRSQAYQAGALRKNNKVLLILVDGLGASMLRQNLSQMPSLRAYFNLNDNSFPLAQSVFPSLTYPNLVTILTRAPIHRHGVLGNQMMYQDQQFGDHVLVNFESRKDSAWLNEVKEPAMVFSQLKSMGRSSASFAQSLYAGATVTNEADLPMGLSYVNKDYWFVDRKNIRSLQTLLRDHPPQNWPDFIFLHLIGVDAIAHEWGPSHGLIAQYLKQLDWALTPLFEQIKKAEENDSMAFGSLLTADHGFMDVKNVVDIDGRLSRQFPNLMIVNEGRHATLIFDEKEPLSNRRLILEQLRNHSAIDWVISHEKDLVTLANKQSRWLFRLQPNLACSTFHFSIVYQEQVFCPSELPKASELPPMPPQSLIHLLSYMDAPQSPDAVVLASADTSFSAQYRGHHGGITEDETLVPLLVRGIELGDPTPVRPLYEVLSVLDLSVTKKGAN